MSHSRDANMWLQYAKDDLAGAMSDLAPHICCFHAQQAAEKAIKAVLVAFDIDFPWIHDLAELSALVPDEVRRNSALTQAPMLTSYATAERYPREAGKISRDAASEAITVASSIVDWATKAIADRLS